MVPIFLVLLILLCSMTSVRCHHNGAPEEACFTMQPAHNGTTQLSTTESKHKIGIAQAQVLRNGNSSRSGGCISSWRCCPVTNIVNFRQNMIAVTLTSSGSDAFKGFFMQARSSTNGDANPVGVWDVSGVAALAKGVACGSRSASSATHVDNSPKPSITLLWMPPSGFAGKVVFIATVVQDFNTYWVGLQSSVLDVRATDTPTLQHPLASAKNMSQQITAQVQKTGNSSNSGNTTQTSSGICGVRGNTNLWISLLILARGWLV